MKRNWRFLVYLCFCNQFLFAENIDCEKITLFLNNKETQIENLNLHDPDYIPLHYLIAQDIIKELNQFRNEVIPSFTECATITFSELINRYDALVNRMQLKHDSLAWLSKNVYLIFYESALHEYQFNNEEDGRYFLDRSLQYNATFPDAILLKLNKLLNANVFEACLSLLQTLYYETEMDRAQEMQAIEFTDKFYDKLYKTGDSLVKIEHASEALELFEILEIFCLNLPTAYCNDDYYHGVLRSKTGIYESYLSIAKVAEKRGNTVIAAHFFQYAQEYLENNPYLKNYELKEEVPPEIPTDSPVSTVLTAPTASSILTHAPPVSTTSPVPNVSITETKATYDNLILQALALCIKENFTEAYNLFVEAKKLEDCRCFTPDFRVDLMIQELLKVIH